MLMSDEKERNAIFAASRLQGVKYSQLINALKVSNVAINRKMLSQIAVVDSNSFKQIVEMCVK
jgi:large subunit ribosomal protein L20